MYVEKLLYKLLDSTIHQSRIKSLISVITAIINTKQLMLTRLGRGLKINGKERAGIRRIDRLLENTFYHTYSGLLFG